MIAGTETDTTRLFCTFRLEGHLFGVDILEVKEVTTELTCTRIPHAPDEVFGLVNIRGHIQLVLDLRRLLGMPPLSRAGDRRFVLFKPIAGNSFGVMVDAISDIYTLPIDQIEPFTSTVHNVLTASLLRVDLISAIGRLPEELLIILNPRRFLTIVEQSFAKTI